MERDLISDNILRQLSIGSNVDSTIYKLTLSRLPGIIRQRLLTVLKTKGRDAAREYLEVIVSNESFKQYSVLLELFK